MLEKVCSKCGNAFECDEDKDTCWCSSYPKLTSDKIDELKDCMCKNCLKKNYFAKLFPSEF